MSAPTAWWDEPAATTAPANARASTPQPAAEVDWLTPPPTAPKALATPQRDTLAEWLDADAPTPGNAAKREERETKRLAIIAAGPKPTGTLAPGDAWLVADWINTPAAVALGNVRFAPGKVAQRMEGDLKRPLLIVNETPGEAWQHLCLAFVWADPAAVYRAVSQIASLEWVEIQNSRSVKQ